MPRTPRCARHAPDACCHVLNRGHARETLFHDPDDFASFRELLARYRESGPFDRFHDCLTTNHVHLLLRLPDARLLSRLIQGVLMA